MLRVRVLYHGAQHEATAGKQRQTQVATYAGFVVGIDVCCRPNGVILPDFVAVAHAREVLRTVGANVLERAACAQMPEVYWYVACPHDGGCRQSPAEVYTVAQHACGVLPIDFLFMTLCVWERCF